MKVKTLLRRAKKCKTQEDADNLLGTLSRVFSNTMQLSHLGQYNSEAYMEDSKPFVRFELNHEISNHYITMIRPEIRDDQLVIVVETNHMHDGLGMFSQSWETVEGMEDVIEFFDNTTISGIAQIAKELAIANHARLIENVGVARSVALEAAERSW